jgi:hypothetical protein
LAGQATGNLLTPCKSVFDPGNYSIPAAIGAGLGGGFGADLANLAQESGTLYTSGIPELDQAIYQGVFGGSGESIGGHF